MTQATSTTSHTDDNGPGFLETVLFTIVFVAIFAGITFGLGVNPDDDQTIETIFVLVIGLGFALLRKHRTGHYTLSPHARATRARQYGSTQWAIEWIAVDVVIAIVAAVVADTWIVFPLLLAGLVVSQLCDTWFWRRIGHRADQQVASGGR